MQRLIGGVLALLAFGVCAAAAPSGTWLAEVEPIITSAERQAYLALADEPSRAAYEEQFFRSRLIDASEYHRRIDYTDTYFGGGKHLSGVNTDQGRVHLSLGAPSKISRFSASRVFFPLEIWYYENPARQFLFFQRNGTGIPQLYSPTQHTIRALLTPQSSTRGLFPSNDQITAADIRARLNLGPLEDEIIDAALGVAWGIKGLGNDAELAKALSPRVALQKPLRPEVVSRLVPASRPFLTQWQTRGPEGEPVVDLQWTLTTPQTIGLRVLRGEAETSSTQQAIPATGAPRIAYQHRLDLLPGSYTLVLHVDGQDTTYPLTVAAPDAGALLIGAELSFPSSPAPFTFADQTLTPTTNGRIALLQLDKPSQVHWRIWQGLTLAWQSTSTASEVFVRQELPSTLPPGRYELEAKTGDQDQRTALVIGPAEAPLPITSYTGNLLPATRWTSLGRQYLALGDRPRARALLQKAAIQSITPDAALGLARLDALDNNLDQAREVAQAVLKLDAQSFEALVLMGYIEARLQDHAIAAHYYSRALAIRPSPAIERARTEALRLSASSR